MTDRPVIFSAPMVAALLREIKQPGTGKTQTRRLAWTEGGFTRSGCAKFPGPSLWQAVKTGDRLWVRENLAVMGNWGVWHNASEAPELGSFLDDIDPRGVALLDRYAPAIATNSALIPSIHMPRWASRITLHVTAVKIERLLCGSLGAGDAEREGLIRVDNEDGSVGWRAFAGEPAFTDPAIAFNVLWDRLHGRGAFFANPEVVALTFKPVLANIDAVPLAA